MTNETTAAPQQDDRFRAGMLRAAEIALSESSPEGSMPLKLQTVPREELVIAVTRAASKSIAGRIRAEAAAPEAPVVIDGTASSEEQVLTHTVFVCKSCGKEFSGRHYCLGLHVPPAPEAPNLTTPDVPVAPKLWLRGREDLLHLRTLIGYARWQVNEGSSHHPTLPSAIAAAQAEYNKISAQLDAVDAAPPAPVQAGEVTEARVNLLQEELRRRYALTPSATACAEMLRAALAAREVR